MKLFKVIVRAVPRPYIIGQGMTLDETTHLISLEAATGDEAKRKAEIVIAEMFQYRRWGLQAQARLFGEGFE